MLLPPKPMLSAFLADHITNGRAYASVVSVCRRGLSRCVVAKRCVLEQKLLLTAYRKSYEKSIGIEMNDLDLYLGSREPLMKVKVKR